MIHVARLEDHFLEALEEARLGAGVHVQAVGHAVIGQVADQCPLHVVGVMAVVQGAGTGEEIEIFAAGLVPHAVAAGPFEGRGEAAAVAADAGFNIIEDRHRGLLALVGVWMLCRVWVNGRVPG